MAENKPNRTTNLKLNTTKSLKKKKISLVILQLLNHALYTFVQELLATLEAQSPSCVLHVIGYKKEEKDWEKHGLTPMLG